MEIDIEFYRQKIKNQWKNIKEDGKLISGTITILVDDKTKEPKKIYTKNIKVWNVEKELNNKIEVELLDS